ncbi:hypothetical protein C8J56DRAFT_1051741 [Mycena floridula]|nr:hypothetical protein C8J56DRAFT_1051741 [Mycena floridula]
MVRVHALDVFNSGPFDLADPEMRQKVDQKAIGVGLNALGYDAGLISLCSGCYGVLGIAPWSVLGLRAQCELHNRTRFGCNIIAERRYKTTRFFVFQVVLED